MQACGEVESHACGACASKDSYFKTCVRLVVPKRHKGALTYAKKGQKYMDQSGDEKVTQVDDELMWEYLFKGSCAGCAFNGNFVCDLIPSKLSLRPLFTRMLIF